MNKILLSALLLVLAGCCGRDHCGKKVEKSTGDNVSVSEIIEIDDIGSGSLAAANKKFDEALGGDRVNFAFDSSALNHCDKEFLDKVAKYLSENSSLKIEIQGNCDIRGSASYNMALGERRATAAAAYLKSKGVAEDKMTTVSFGARVLFEGDTEEIYAKNRVSIIVIKR